MRPGQYVVWAGNQNPWCAPGYNGTVLAVAANDPGSIKVLWEERIEMFGKTNAYTWERHANLTPVMR
jgi:hypothetical protein